MRKLARVTTLHLEPPVYQTVNSEFVVWACLCLGMAMRGHQGHHGPLPGDGPTCSIASSHLLMIFKFVTVVKVIAVENKVTREIDGAMLLCVPFSIFVVMRIEP